MIDFMLLFTKRSAIIRFLMNLGGGGMLNLVYGLSSSSYVDCVVFFGDECLLIDGLGFVCPCARPVVRLLIFGSSFCCSPCRWMSSRRLPVIIFVSLIEFMIMFMLCVVRRAFGGRRRLLHHLRAIACLPLRLVHSLLFLLLPPRCLSATFGC